MFKAVDEIVVEPRSNFPRTKSESQGNFPRHVLFPQVPLADFRPGPLVKWEDVLGIVDHYTGPGTSTAEQVLSHLYGHSPELTRAHASYGGFKTKYYSVKRTLQAARTTEEKATVRRAPLIVSEPGGAGGGGGTSCKKVSATSVHTQNWCAPR